MTPEEQRKVWATIDRDHLISVATRGPAPVFATISGAHLYGFASPDSDIDLRGAFLWSAREMLGLTPPDETLTIVDQTTIDLDWVAHDLRKFARMMTNHNGYVLEQLYSPLIVITSPLHEELMDLGRGCVTRPTVRHYQGFARGRRERLAEPEPTVKHLLYAYRVLLTGIHLMQTGQVVANITTLNDRFALREVSELVARKQEGAEKMRLEERELASHAGVLDRLADELTTAHGESRLPEAPTTTRALEDLVVRARLEGAMSRDPSR